MMMGVRQTGLGSLVDLSTPCKPPPREILWQARHLIGPISPPFHTDRTQPGFVTPPLTKYGEKILPISNCVIFALGSD